MSRNLIIQRAIENVYASYAGKGGIPLDSLGKRLLFAWTQADINILLTSYLTPESRIQIWRNVQERVSQIAPFLKLDADPYAVVSEGKLYWIQDAYTTSDRFPYSNPHSAGFGDGLNYIRNSVKAIVDMYDGTVSFYVMDPHDPVLAVYRRAFPVCSRIWINSRPISSSTCVIRRISSESRRPNTRAST